MKKLIFFLTALFATTFSAHCQTNKKVDTPEDVGKYAFNVLKNFDNISGEEFIDKLFTIEELKAYVEKHMDDTTESEVKDQINRLTVEGYNARIKEEYTVLKEKATKYSIKWNAIEYLAFEYKEKSEQAFTGIRGKLLFTHKGSVYQVDVQAFKIDNKYIPYIILQLSEKAEN